MERLLKHEFRLLNKCGFHIVEFLNKYHHPVDYLDDFIGDHGEGMFEFEKDMK